MSFLMRTSILLFVVLTLAFPALTQDIEAQNTEEIPLFSLSVGKAEFIDVDRAYLLQGEKVERFLQSDYYRSEGALNLEEGSWSLIVSGLGGDHETTYGGRDFPNADIELNASPSRCISELNVPASKAFRVICPLRLLKFEIRSDSSHTLLLITQLSRANALTITLTPTNTPTSTLTFTPTNTPSITPTPTITPTSTLTYTPTPSRTPRPTAHPDAGRYHISRSGGVNVRSCASTSCSIVAQYEYGRYVEVESIEAGQAVGGDTRWARTIEDNYIHVSLLKKGARPPTVTPTQRPVVQRNPTVAPLAPSNLEELLVYALAVGADRSTLQYVRDVHEAWELLGYSDMSIWWVYLYGMASFFRSAYEGCNFTYELITNQQVKALMLAELNSAMAAPDPAFPRDFVFDGYASLLYRLHC